MNSILFARSVAFGLLDAFVKREPLTPPRRLSFVYGDGDAAAIGREFRNHFVELGGMKPTDAVLDIGCGIGRMAVPLVEYLGDGHYDGFDTIKRGVSWCQKNITARFSNFQFQHADIYNLSYNPSGKISPSAFRFPYEDSRFDFSFATSVFTHMFPGDVAHYVGEAARVLKPGGSSLFTWFILNDQSLRMIGQGQSRIPMTHELADGCRAKSARVPEKAIGIPETTVRSIYADAGLEIVEPIQFGSWCGRDHGVSFQDLVIARRLIASH